MIAISTDLMINKVYFNVLMLSHDK